MEDQELEFLKEGIRQYVETWGWDKFEEMIQAELGFELVRSEKVYRKADGSVITVTYEAGDAKRAEAKAEGEQVQAFVQVSRLKGSAGREGQESGVGEGEEDGEPRWYQLFVAAPEGNMYQNSNEMWQVQERLREVGPAVLIAPFNGLPLKNERGEYEVRVYRANILALVKMVLEDNFGLVIVSEKARWED